MKLEKIAYGGWNNCYRLANESIELVVTGDVGPRIIRLAAPGGENLFKEFSDMMGKTGGDQWRIYGGHRLWHAPEANPRTYHPDNDPVEVRSTESGLEALQPVESTTGIEKQIEVSLGESEPQVKVTHRLINRNLWPVKLSVWALSVMAPGGIALIPQPPYEPHGERLSPSHPMTLWPYTTMNDQRWRWGERFIRLRQDSSSTAPQKIGMALLPGKGFYVLNDKLFMKSYEHQPGAAYPDFGCSFEAFTNEEMLEMESLSPFCELQPDEKTQHVEHWHVFSDFRVPESDRELEERLDALV